MNEALLIAESALFLLFSALLFRKERIYGFYFFFLFVYAIFAQIGYLYAPELSMFLHAYFGEEIWVEVTSFIILSGVTLFFFLYYFSSGFIRVLQSTGLCLYVDRRNGAFYKRMAIAGIVLVPAIQYSILIAKFDQLNWTEAAGDDIFQANLPVAIFVFLVKLWVLPNIAMYCFLRQYPIFRNSRRLWTLCIFSMLSFLLFTFKIGNRSDSLAFALGIAVFETSQIKLRFRGLLAIGLAGSALFAYLNTIYSHRAVDVIPNDTLYSIVFKDYFPPAHILFAAVSYNYVDPAEVVISNTSNALIMLNHPLLQMTITDLFRAGVATRSQGYGFYVFTEGFMFSGFSGFLYNGIVLGMLMTFWRSLAMTNSKKFNYFLLAVMGGMVVNVVRGQSSYFVKYLYMLVLPSVLVYLALTNQRVRLRIRRRRGSAAG